MSSLYIFRTILVASISLFASTSTILLSISDTSTWYFFILLQKYTAFRRKKQKDQILTKKIEIDQIILAISIWSPTFAEKSYGRKEMDYNGTDARSTEERPRQWTWVYALSWWYAPLHTLAWIWFKEESLWSLYRLVWVWLVHRGWISKWLCRTLVAEGCIGFKKYPKNSWNHAHSTSVSSHKKISPMRQRHTGDIDIRHHAYSIASMSCSKSLGSVVGA